MKIVDREEIVWGCEIYDGVACEIVDLDDLRAEVWHYLEEEVTEGNFVLVDRELEGQDFYLLAALVLDHKGPEGFVGHGNGKHRANKYL